MRYFIDIAYKGTNYHGWQVQQNAHTVQQELENALETIFRTKVETLASGRTDTGVHATQQIVHLDIDVDFTDKNLYQLNKILPWDISIKNFYPVHSEAHARFDAESRAYEYRITTVKNPFLVDEAYFFEKPLDIKKMNEAAALLLSHQDFEAFSKVHTEVNNFLCTIYFAQWKQKGNLLIFEIEANRFLRGMVRAIVGSLLPIGLGKSTVENFEKIILSKSRQEAGPSISPSGLFLTSVKYPDSVYLQE